MLAEVLLAAVVAKTVVGPNVAELSWAGDHRKGLLSFRLRVTVEEMILSITESLESAAKI